MKYGRLTVIEQGSVWVCRCDCGAIVRKPRQLVTLFPEASSCGCLMREAGQRARQQDRERAQQRQAEAHKQKLELQRKRELRRQERRELSGAYSSWRAMHDRCYDAYNPSYKSYGARGIQVCERWHRRNKAGFANFASDMGKKPQGYSIERVNVNGNYTPHNCKWIPLRQQGCNTRATERTATRKIVLNVCRGVTALDAS